MIPEALQEEAAICASGALQAEERIRFEAELEFDPDLRLFLTGLEEIAAAAIVAPAPPEWQEGAASRKERILNAALSRPQTAKEGLVVAGPEGGVTWVNESFQEMCGYDLAELRGKKLGPILQGKLTDRQSAERLRRAVRERSACVEELLNYHKDGHPYWVRIEITPHYDAAGAFHRFVAREHELTGRPIPEPAAT